MASHFCEHHQGMCAWTTKEKRVLERWRVFQELHHPHRHPQLRLARRDDAVVAGVAVPGVPVMWGL